MSFDDMAKAIVVFYKSGAHLGFHLKVRVVYKSMFYTQTLDIRSEIKNTPLSSLSLTFTFFSL